MSIPLFEFRTPLLNAAGFLGFAPNPRGPLPLEHLGGFITNPISRRPHQPTRHPLTEPGPGSVLLHSGLPNPGLRAAIRRHAPAWARAPLPILVHLMAEDPTEMGEMVRALEGLENVLAIELGLPETLGERAVAELIVATQGELPVIARLPLSAQNLAASAAAAGASAISLGPLPGARLSSGASQRGRLYGPGLYPAALAAVTALAGLGVPVIGGGGVYTPEQAEGLLAAGAQAVQLDGILWRGMEAWGVA